MRSRRLRANGHFIPYSAFAARKSFFVTKETGILMQKQEAPKAVSAVDTSSVELSSDEMAEEQARAIEAHLQSSGYRLEQQQGGFQNWGYGSE